MEYLKKILDDWGIKIRKIVAENKKS